VEYRVEQLAASCEVSVDTVRYYQSMGLLPPPRRAGRVALYDRSHVERIRQIRALQRKGLTLAVIDRMMNGRLGKADADLAAAVAAAQGDDEDEFLTLEEVAERSGVPSALLRAIERAGLALGRKIDGEERYSAADIEVVRQGLRLLEAGFPVADLLELGKSYDQAARVLATHAVEMFDVHVREPIRTSDADDEAKAERLVAAFRDLLPAVTALVTHHFRRVLLAAAEDHIERAGDEAARSALREVHG